jgi:hypothetical protein
VGGVDVHLDGAASEVGTTDATGAYTFSGLSESNWTVEALKQGGAGSGISTLDAVYVLQGVVGVRQFDSAQGLACDVSGDGTLSTLDAVFILQYVVGLIPRLPVAQVCGSDWAFVPVPAAAANQSLIEPQMTAGSCQHGAILLDPLVSDASGQDFSAVLFGDCSGDWQPPTGGTRAAFVSRSSSNAPTVRLGMGRRRRGATVRFPVVVESRDVFYSLSSEISYDPRELRLAGVHSFTAAPDVLVEYNADVAGKVVIAVASAEPLAGGRAKVLALDFERRTSGALARPHVHAASVDERPAAADPAE